MLNASRKLGRRNFVNVVSQQLICGKKVRCRIISSRLPRIERVAVNPAEDKLIFAICPRISTNKPNAVEIFFHDSLRLEFQLHCSKPRPAGNN